MKALSPGTPAKTLGIVIQALYVVFFVSLVWDVRALNSILPAPMLLAGIFYNRSVRGSFFSTHIKNFFLYGCVALFLVFLIALNINPNRDAGWINIQTKVALVFVPLAVQYTNDFNQKTRIRLMLAYSAIVVAAGIFCLGYAAIDYLNTGQTSSFFYHDLASPVGGHAIYTSVLVFIALVILNEMQLNERWQKILRPGFTGCLSLFLFFLSSKLLIGFYLLYLMFRLIQAARKRVMNRNLVLGLAGLFVAGVLLIAFTNNPVSRRFNDLANGDLKVIRMKQFNPGMYFNGIQFRLLEWRFTAEILDENNSWLTGVGPGNAQPLLNQKYISTNMYIGEIARGDHGFIGYNTHNQFLETVLQAGMPGLIALLFTCLALARMAWKRKERTLGFIVVLLLAWLFAEAALERQYGIMIFTFFPLFLNPAEKRRAGQTFLA